MKNLNHLDKFRIPYFGMMGNESNGTFRLKIKGETYLVVASKGAGWEHVSISHKHKIPSWKTMCELKDMFFEEDEVVMQLHPAKKEYKNLCNTCLHLWKPIDGSIPTPPRSLV